MGSAGNDGLGNDLARADAAALAAAFAAGTVSPVEATTAALARIEEVNPQVNAFTLVDTEGALVAARASEERWRARRPLSRTDGVPATIKDIVYAAGWPTLRGSLLTGDPAPDLEDSPAVARLKETGAVLLGRTTTPEFGWKGVTDSRRHGATGNPWGADLTSGGSSGGSATAVGLGMGAWSVGTDGGGSVRIPGAFTGTAALKPTLARVPVYPPSAYGSLSHVGPMARTVTDVALMLDVIGRPDPRDWMGLDTPPAPFVSGLERGVEGLRVAFSPDLGYVTNDPEVDDAVRAAAQVFADAGAIVEGVDPGFTDPREAFHTLWFTGADQVVRLFGDGATPAELADRIDPLLAATLPPFADVSAADYLRAAAVQQGLGVLMGQFHQTHDVLLTPTMPIAAFAIGQDTPDGWPDPLWTSWTPYTYPFNMTGQPALTLPCGLTSAGRPVGLQVVGARHRDALVLRAGRAYEARTDWHRRVPTLLATTP